MSVRFGLTHTVCLLFALGEFDISEIKKNERPRGLVFNGDASLEYCLEACADKVPSNYHIWHDAWSPTQTCEWYSAESNRCARYGRYYINYGMNANEACCVCGGGYQYINTSTPDTSRIVTDSTDHFKVQITELDPDYERPCERAIILTKPMPDQTSSVWHETRQTISDGFETRFEFRFSNRSRFCDSAEKKNDARVPLYKVCKNVMSNVFQSQMEGGDGFAFVIHNSENETQALGDGAGGLGYQGIRSSLAIEFDTFSNAGEPNFPHISIRAAGINQMNYAHSTSSIGKRETRDGVRYSSVETELAPAVQVNMTDGEFHEARIVLYNGIKDSYLSAYRATQNLKKFATEPISTLCVFLDDLANPKVCVPFNIYSLMPLIDNQAIIGFTASTGRQWQVAEIKSWRFCESGECS